MLFFVRYTYVADDWLCLKKGGCISITNEELLKSLINEPDTVDFVVRKNENFEAFVKENKEIAISLTLAGKYALCYTKQDNFVNIITELGTSFIGSISLVLGTLGRASLENAGILPVHRQPYLDLRGRDVIIGIVDTGIDYTLDVFRYEDGTSKIQFIYDQTAVGKAPEGYYLGEEYTQEEINAALQAPNPLEVVPTQDTSGHGTFLASVAAGRQVGDFIGAAPDAEIIAVKLRRARPYYLDLYSVPEDQEHAYESSAVMVGIEYILKRARELNKPAVICIGLGTNFGGHDGFSIFEEYLYDISNLKGTCLCTAAGNECKARHHMQGIISSKGETQNVDLRVGENAGDIFISIWNNMADRTAVSVISPTGESVGRVPVKPGITKTTNLVLEASSVTITYYFPMEGTGSQLTIVKINNASPGIWTITVHGDVILDGRFQVWLPMTGFVDPSVEFLSTSPYYTLTVPATAFGTICAGAYDANQNSLYPNSSWGPNREDRLGPDLVAPGVGIEGFYPNGRGTMEGTSVATAITVGACALMMQWGVVEGNDVSFSTYKIRAYIIRGCERNEGMQYPNPQWGYGSLNLMQSFKLMREL